MHKINFKIILFFGLACLFVFVILSFKNAKQTNAEPQLIKSVSTQEPGKQKQAKKEVKTYNSESDNGESEVKSDYFSPDPYINQLIILATLSDCIEFLSLTQKQLEGDDFWQSNLVRHKSKKVKQQLKNRIKECQEINAEHPEFNLTDRTKIERKAFKLESQNLMQQVLKYKKHIGDDEQLNQQFFSELANADKRILLTTNAYYAMHDYYSQYAYKIMDLLQTQQLVYAWETASVAQTIYGCNVNGGCDGFSVPLMYQCKRIDESLCYLNDYNEYIKVAYSPGQQADIAIMLAYIEGLFADAINQE